MSDTRVCENCQSEVAPDATFCPRCGQRFAPAAAPAVPEPPPVPVAPPVTPPVVPVAPPAAPPPVAPVAPPAPPPPPATPFVAPTTAAGGPRPKPVWPAILIGCGVLFLIVAVVAGFAIHHGYQKAKAGIAEVQKEFETTQKTGTGTDTSGTTDAKTDDDTSGKTDDTGTGDEKAPVIEVGDGDPKNPPRAYACDQVPPLEVAEGKEFGPVDNGDQAAGLVLAMPDVQAWVKAIEEARAEGKKRTAMLTVETIPGSGNYLVHLFENVEDDDPGHTATFGWFKVDEGTGAVSNQTDG